MLVILALMYYLRALIWEDLYSMCLNTQLRYFSLSYHVFKASHQVCPEISKKENGQLIKHSNNVSLTGFFFMHDYLYALSVGISDYLGSYDVEPLWITKCEKTICSHIRRWPTIICYVIIAICLCSKAAITHSSCIFQVCICLCSVSVIRHKD